jgi:hypothetical protein
MPHEFRTIEQFVQLLDEWSHKSMEASKQPSFTDRQAGFEMGLSRAYAGMAQILRTSNIGIVYPPTEGE